MSLISNCVVSCEDDSLCSDTQYSSRNRGFHNRVAAVDFVRACQLPVFVQLNIPETGGPGQLALLKILPLNRACQVPTNCCRSAWLG